jgi:putative transposase
VPKQLATEVNETWNKDFVADALFDSRKMHRLTGVDPFSREGLAVDIRQSLKGNDVVRVLTDIVKGRGLPTTIEKDYAGAESFNGRRRRKCLNANRFLELADARTKIGVWRT